VAFDYNRPSKTKAGGPDALRLMAVAEPRNGSGPLARRCRKERGMSTYIVLGNFTDQGIRNVKDTTKRASAVKEAAAKFGVSVTKLYWTLGAYDVVTIVDAPDDQAVAALLFSIGSLGNVRTQSLKAFEADDVEGILKKI
jgi:uncharacterized protein with GYD domain